MERREFCRFVGACAVVGCTGALTGCARLFDSSGAETGTAELQVKPGRPAPSANGTASADVTSTPGAPSTPDLALFKGDDPGRNARAAVGALGGMERFVRSGDLVVIKPNVVVGREPKYATTTNPSVVAAVVKMAIEAGAKDVVVTDRPTGAVRNAFEVSGIAGAVAAAGGRVKYLSDRDFVKTAIPQGKVLKSFLMLRDVFDADVFINMPIAKDHAMAGLTMSVKNLMGILGGSRGVMHQEFSQKIVDVNSLVRPHLIVLDAYRILVKNGPTGGDLGDVRTPKTCIAGTDAFAVDSLATELFGMKPTDIDYLYDGGARGVGVIDLSKLTVLRGES